MRTERLGSYKRGQLVSDILEMMQVFTDEEIPRPLAENTLNRVVGKFHELAGWKDHDEYKDRVGVPIIFSVNSDEEPASGYDSDEFVLTVPLTGAVAWENMTGFDDNWLGARGVLVETVGNTNYGIQVVGIIDSTHVIVESTDRTITIPTIAGANLVVNLSTSANKEATEINLAVLPAYKRIDLIKSMTSTAVRRGLCVGPDKVTEKTFGSMIKSHNYADQIIWYREGEKIYRGRVATADGGRLTSFGDCTLHVVLSPEPMLDDEDLIDVKDSNVQQVIDATKVELYNAMPSGKMKAPLPQALMNWYNELFGQKKATEEEKAK